MKGRWPKPLTLAVLLAMITTVTALAVVLLPREPHYGGKPLSYWVQRIDFTATSEGRAAVAEIGTNAIPLLLRKAGGNDLARTLHRVYQTFRSKLPKGAQRLFPKPKPSDYEFPYRRRFGAECFGTVSDPCFEGSFGPSQ
jgi:hypothetical protein